MIPGKGATVNRREFVQRMAAMMAAAPRPEVAAQAGRPNLVFVFADQMRFCEMGCAGNEYIRTPHLDRLAAQGVQLTNAFSSAPVCSPYRAQLLTGKYSNANGVPTNDVHMPETQDTIAKALRREGYATGYIGKWHLDGGRRAPKNDPRSQGFVPAGGARQGFDFWAALECAHQYYHTHYFRDTPDPIPVNAYEPGVQTDIAIEFLKQRKDHPFCLYLSWGPPHNPYEPPEGYRTYSPAKVPLRPNVPREFEEEARRTLALYYGLISSLDENIGRITRALDDLNLTSNTILCFSSDHGDMHRSQGHLLKQKPWEESAHIPFLLRFPKQIRGGQKRDLLFNSVDVMPTLLGLCGAAVPKEVQGMDLAEVLRGRQTKEPDSVYLSLDSGELPRGAGGKWRAVRTKESLYAIREGREWLFYDLRKDPYEMRNLVDDRSAAAQKAQLRRKLEGWMERVGNAVPLVGKA
jgi:arylsulfatase A-like enzyme